MKIGIDLDSTLNNLEVAWSQWIVNALDPAFTLDKWTSWQINELCRGGNHVYDFLNMRGVFLGLSPQPHAQQVTLGLMNWPNDHELFVVTSTVAANWPEKAQWLAMHFPHIPSSNHIVCHKKGLLNLDVLIDDGLHNFAGFKGRGIVLDKPWNRMATMERAADWPQIGRLLGAKIEEIKS